MVRANATKHLGSSLFSTFPKCDILLNNTCEVFNKLVIDTREMPILSMLEKIMGQLMSRVYNKQKEVMEKWTGPVYPKIRKKLLKNSEMAYICYVVPAGKGIFQVQDRASQYVVDIINMECECRRWDLTGIPCNHVISCLRHERIAPEDLLPSFYSNETYSKVYGFNIMPCSDRFTWEKTNGPPVQPPVYLKKAGRPPKSRRKQPHEVQGKNGPKLSKHGIIITCRWCKGEGHNSSGCALKKKRIIPDQVLNNPVVVDNLEDEPVITQVCRRLEYNNLVNRC